MVAKANTLSKVQAMCTVQASQGLSYDATGSRRQMQSVQRIVPKDKSNTTAAADWHDFHQCRPRNAGRLDNKQGSDTA